MVKINLFLIAGFKLPIHYIFDVFDTWHIFCIKIICICFRSPEIYWRDQFVCYNCSSLTPPRHLRLNTKQAYYYKLNLWVDLSSLITTRFGIRLTIWTTSFSWVELFIYLLFFCNKICINMKIFARLILYWIEKKYILKLCFLFLHYCTHVQKTVLWSTR